MAVDTNEITGFIGNCNNIGLLLAYRTHIEERLKLLGHDPKPAKPKAPPKPAHPVPPPAPPLVSLPKMPVLHGPDEVK